MATGFPVKANYATGDVLSAANMNDLAGTLNYLDPTAKGDLFPASDASTLTRLAVGTNGQVLTADSTAATGMKWSAGASGALTFITSTSLSGSSVSINNCFSSTYDNYMIITTNMVGTTAGDDVLLKLRASGTDASTNYNRYIWGTTNYGANTGSTEMRVGLTSTGTSYVRCFISNPFAAAPTSFDFSSFRGNAAWVGNGWHSTATSYDGFTISPTGGTFTGTVTVYGYSKS